MLTLLKLESLEKRRLDADLVLFHKILLGEISLKPSSKPVFKVSLTRGSKLKMRTPNIRSNVRFNFFLMSMSRLYPKLPNNLQNASTSKQFKSILKNIDLIKLIN